MNSLKQLMTSCKHWFLSEKGFALVIIILGAFFVAVGIHRFRVRPEHFGLMSFLGCVAGAFGAFFLLLFTDYLLHHARLVFIPWFLFLIYFAIIEPHLGVGLGLALGFIVVGQLRS
ncbi:MAG: hypothetical protein WAO35_05760 [Terriglobia bacterium]